MRRVRERGGRRADRRSDIVNGKTQPGACSFTSVCKLNCDPVERTRCMWWTNKPELPAPDQIPLIPPRELEPCHCVDECQGVLRPNCRIRQGGAVPHGNIVNKEEPK